MKRILVTGGCGFIGHHFVEHLIKTTNWEIVILDRLNYSSYGFDRLRDINVFDEKRVKIFASDITKPITEYLEREIGELDYIVHMAAETHVDNSIRDPRLFVMTNVIGTTEILEFARRQKSLQKFIYFGTDEIFGPAPDGIAYKEWDRYNCTNPYSAAKAGGEELCLAYANCYKLPIVITHTMNNYGERQHPEKFIPLIIKSVLKNHVVLIHSSKDRKRVGSRFYIHARNVASAVFFLLSRGEFREKYNIVGEKEVDNLTLALLIAKIIGEQIKYELVDFHSSRPGHDLRYALDGSKMTKIGWSPPVDFEKSLEKTVKWYISNPKWLECR